MFIFGALDKPFVDKALKSILRVGSKLPKQLDATSNHKSLGSNISHGTGLTGILTLATVG